MISHKVVLKFVAVFWLFIAMEGCFGEKSELPAKPPLAVKIVACKRGDIKETIRYVGTVHSKNEINILARVSGKIADLPVQEGEEVKEGTYLALITAPEMSARVSRTRAELLKAKEESTFLCEQAALDRELLKKGSVSKILVDSSMQKCRSSRAAYKAAKAGLKEIRSIAGNVTESAPFTGKVLKWLTEPGENIMPGRPILKFGDNQLEVRVSVNEKDINAGIKNDTRALLTFKNGTVIRSAIYKISPMATGMGRMIEVRILLKKEVAALVKHGMSVDVSFIMDEKEDALVIPVNAVAEKGSSKGVYKIIKNKAVWKKVITSIQEGGLIAAEGDIKEGDWVVAGNLDVLKDGAEIYPVKAEEVTP
jgi:RND family efflux transporter MFP subunit